MKIDKEEKDQAVQFLVLLSAGVVLSAVVIGIWAKAIFAGGNWWFLFLASGLGAIVAGEWIKRRMEALVKLSREARRKAKR